jgi:opacity protein-like surface antigen
MTYGASIGWMGAGIFGWEADLAYTPEFFEAGDGDIDFVDNSNATSWMANVLIGIPVGGQRGGGFRPYATGGIGVLQTNVNSAGDLFEINNNEFGMNVGFGAFGFATDHIGFRGDVRYYRALTDPEKDNEFDIDFGDFDFWRGTFGVTFRW